MNDGGQGQRENDATTGLEPGERQSADQERIVELEAEAVVDRKVVSALAEQGLADRVEIAQLKSALVTSRRIGAAMGILMATLKLDEDAAFTRLRIHSQNTNRKLRDVADDVLYSGALPDQP